MCKATTVVEMKDLIMQWEIDPVLNGLDLKMEPGERLAIVGPSSSGNSSILIL